MRSGSEASSECWWGVGYYLNDMWPRRQVEMILQYPVRNFRCPFCGAKMRTEEYKYLKPWVCQSCSAELQFSAANGRILTFCFIGVALLLLYLMGLRGWQLALAVIPAGFILTFIFTVPLDRILPRRLEPFCPPPPLPPLPWTDEKFTTLFPHEDSNGDKPNQSDQSEVETPKDSSGSVGNRV